MELGRILDGVFRLLHKEKADGISTNLPVKMLSLYAMPSKSGGKFYTSFCIFYFVRNTVVVENCPCDIQPQATSARIAVSGFIHPKERDK